VLKKHLRPEPQLKAGEWLAAHHMATAMIDTSDGLSTDLGHICKASGVGAVLWAAKIPLVRVPAELQKRGLDALDLALNGGEDYELLFTVPSWGASRLPGTVGGVPVTVIGEITRPTNIQLVDSNGKSRRRQPGGWEPFRGRRTRP
jgi:thiamine-monophosphate kinase